MIEKTWLIVIGLVLFIFELLFGAITGLDLAMLGLSLMAGGLVYFFFLNWFQSLTIALVLIIIYFVYFRQSWRKKMLIWCQIIGIDAIVGKTGVVVKPVSGHKAGSVLIDGEIWVAKAKKNIPEKQKIMVLKYQKEQLLICSY
jgi:inner membrane protein